MVTRWWWVRHGPTHEKAFVGWRDVPADLSDTAALARLNAFLPETALVISSDLSRAITTADALSLGRPRLPHDPGLREFNFGAWDGLRFDAVAARDPDLSRRFWEEPGDIAAPEGESWNAVAARVTPVVDRLNGTATDIIAVAHIGVIMTQIARAAGTDPYQAMSHKIDNLSVTRLEHGADGWKVRQINHTP